MKTSEGVKSDVKVSDIASNATHAHTIDTIGFGYAAIDVAFEPVLAAGTNSAVAKVITLEHGDTTSSYSAVSGFASGTNYTIPTPANTNVTSIVRFNVDLEGKKRYLKVSVTPQTDIAVATNVRLDVSEKVPTDATSAGVSVFVSG